MTDEQPQVLTDAQARARKLWVRQLLWEYSDDPDSYEQESDEYAKLGAELEAAEAEVRRLEKLWDEGKLE